MYRAVAMSSTVVALFKAHLVNIIIGLSHAQAALNICPAIPYT